MAVTYSNLIVDQGTTFSVTIEVFDSEGDPLNLSSYNGARAQFRKSYMSKLAYNFTAEIAGNPEDGKVTLSLTSAETSAIPPGRYVYDVELYKAVDPYLENVIRIIQGEVEITPEITR